LGLISHDGSQRVQINELILKKRERTVTAVTFWSGEVNVMTTFFLKMNSGVLTELRRLLHLASNGLARRHQHLCRSRSAAADVNY